MSDTSEILNIDAQVSDVPADDSNVEGDQSEASASSDIDVEVVIASVAPDTQVTFDTESEPDEGTLEYFFHLINSCDLTEAQKYGFKGCGAFLTNIGVNLFPLDPNEEVQNIEELYIRCRHLLREIIDVTVLVAKQRNNGAHLKTLQAFNVNPEDKYLWSNYQQRSELINEQVVEPTEDEKRAIQALTLLFHVQLYHPFLEFIGDEDSMEPRFMRIMSALFDKTMRWLEEYQTWCREWSAFKDVYMVPFAYRIQHSPQAQRDMQEMMRLQELAEAQKHPEAPELEIQALERLRLHASQSDGEDDDIVDEYSII